MSETFHYTISETLAGQRLDKALSALHGDLSRARLQALIDERQVTLNGNIISRASHKVAISDIVSLRIPEAKPALPEPEDIQLNIIYEDDDLLVINKHAGLVVHPGAGNMAGTLVNALLHHCGDSLSGIGGVMRPGIVHRLDKDTTGLMVVAKHDKAHQGLAAQLEDRSLSRIYDAMTLGIPMPPKGVIDMPIGRDPRNRLKMAVNTRDGKAAKTHYKMLGEFAGRFAHIECKLESGRTHQIRVHMAARKCPLIGDPLYGPQKTAVQAALKALDCDDEGKNEILTLPRQALHAKSIAFTHPMSGKTHEYTCNLPDDFAGVLELLQKA